MRGGTIIAKPNHFKINVYTYKHTIFTGLYFKTTLIISALNLVPKCRFCVLLIGPPDSKIKIFKVVLNGGITV